VILRRGDHLGPYVITGSHPGGGLRGLHNTSQRVVQLEVRPADSTIRILRAGSIVASLGHPGIASIVDRGLHPDHGAWVANELAEGVVLSEILARRRLTADEGLALIRDLAEITGYAHARAIVHGALRADAVLIRTGERDFPIQLAGWVDLRMAGAIDDVIDLHVYTAPEVLHRVIDGRADVYAIGVLAYRALTGKLPGVVAPERIAGVPPLLANLIVRMLERDPERRPTAAELLAATSSAADRALTGPRFATPRWTPAPDPDGERMSNVIDLAAARRARS
jgi:eukaryotic-like serine/threonine-protein kinase